MKKQQTNYDIMNDVIEKVSKKANISNNNALAFLCYMCFMPVGHSYIKISKNELHMRVQPIADKCNFNFICEKFKNKKELKQYIELFITCYSNQLKREGAFSNIILKLINHNKLNKKLAQVFTPQAVSDGVFKCLNVEAEQSNKKKDKPIWRIAELSTGIGTMVLSSLKYFYDNEKETLHKTILIINEIDPILCIIAIFNLSMSSFMFSDARYLMLKIFNNDAILDYNEREGGDSTNGEIIFDVPTYQFKITCETMMESMVQVEEELLKAA